MAFSQIWIGTAASGSGYVIRVVGRGTMAESRHVKAAAQEVLDDKQAALAIDLAECCYLDSTFIGMLVALEKHCVAERKTFALTNPSAACLDLFHHMNLQKIWDIKPETPVIEGEWQPISTESLHPQELGHHVLDCHRHLAATGPEQQKEFGGVVERLAKELE